jgi:hypothetical protein
VLGLRWASVSSVHLLKKSVTLAFKCMVAEAPGDFGCSLWRLRHDATWTGFGSGPRWPFHFLGPFGSCTMDLGGSFLPLLYIAWLGWVIFFTIDCGLLPSVRSCPLYYFHTHVERQLHSFPETCDGLSLQHRSCLR